MDLYVDLLQFYRCKSFPELLERTAQAFEETGFPHLVLKWTPTAGSDARMLKNSSIVWSNLGHSLGAKADEVAQVLTESMAVALGQERLNTMERQSWRLVQNAPYRLRRDAPKSFFLTTYQRTILRDFGEAEWSEFIAFPLVKERERILVLEAKTQSLVSDQATEQAGFILSVFDCVYQCLHRPLIMPVGQVSNDEIAPVLSRREVQCMHWLAAGKTFSEAATILAISERTLRFHIGNAKKRLGVSSTMQAVVVAAMLYGFDPKDPRRSIYTASREPMQEAALKAG